MTQTQFAFAAPAPAANAAPAPKMDLSASSRYTSHMFSGATGQSIVDAGLAVGDIITLDGIGPYTVASVDIDLDGVSAPYVTVDWGTSTRSAAAKARAARPSKSRASKSRAPKRTSRPRRTTRRVDPVDAGVDEGDWGGIAGVDPMTGRYYR